MKAFRYKLQKVLEYKLQLEDQAKLELAAAEAQVTACKRFIEDIVAQRRAHEDEMAAKPAPTIQDMWLSRLYRERLLHDLREAQRQLADLEAVRNERLAHLVERSKDRKTLEKLKEKQAERHAKDALAEEQHQYDEQSTARYQPPAF